MVHVWLSAFSPFLVNYDLISPPPVVLLRDSTMFAACRWYSAVLKLCIAFSSNGDDLPTQTLIGFVRLWFFCMIPRCLQVILCCFAIVYCIQQQWRWNPYLNSHWFAALGLPHVHMCLMYKPVHTATSIGLNMGTHIAYIHAEYFFSWPCDCHNVMTRKPLLE